MMSCVNDSLYMTNSVNNSQNALDGLINVYIICSNMMSCVKDSLYMANSVNNGQNALDGMVLSKLALYAAICSG